MRRCGRDAVVLLVLGLGGCAANQGEKRIAQPVAEPVRGVEADRVDDRTWETWPPAPVPMSGPAAAMSNDETGPPLRVEWKESGWPLVELTDLVARTTHRPILFETANNVFKMSKLDFDGPIEVPQSKVFAWFQAVIAQKKLVAVPTGPVLANGETCWYLMDQAEPAMRMHPTWIDEGQVYAHADRDGLLVATALRLRDTVDPTRVRNAANLLTTATAGIGKVADVGRFLVVLDFAPVVATIKRFVDRVNAETPPSAAMKPLPPPAPAAR